MTDSEFSPPAQADATAASLAALRAELDGIDDALHELLRQRAEIVTRVARTKDGVALRPGREAAILRRLIARHEGPLAPVAIIRIWRELFAATTALQGRFVVTVAETDPAHALTTIAREHFGAATPLRVWQTSNQALADLASGAAAVAVLPVAAEEDGPGTWWTQLLSPTQRHVHIVGLLPFWLPRPEGASRAQAMLLSAVPPDPSGADRTLIGLELHEQTSRTRLSASLTESGLPLLSLQLRPHGATLATLDGFIEADDPRLAVLSDLHLAPVRLGAYAIPVGETP
jgi:chorismate mutase / prephenate dehydratase